MKRLKLTYMGLVLIAAYQLASAQFVLREAEFPGSVRFSPSRLMDVAGLRTGQVWQNKQQAEAGGRALVRFYQEEGFLLARLDSLRIQTDSTTASVKLVFYLHPGKTVEIGTLEIQSDSLAADVVREQMDLQKGDPYRREVLESELTQGYRFFAGNGFPFARADIRHTQLRPEDDALLADIGVQFHAGPLVHLDDIRASGNRHTREYVILRETGIQPGERYDPRRIEKIPQILNRMGIFESVAQPELQLTGDGKYILNIPVVEGNATSFDGIVGYIPPDKADPTAQGYVTGLVNLSFRNLFGTARRFEVNWQKADRWSEDFRLEYEEPWFLGYPVNIGGGLSRLVRDTTYIELNYFLSSTMHLTTDLKATLQLNQQKTVPDSLASVTLGLARTITNSAEIGIVYDTRDYPVNPRSGMKYLTNYSYGIKQNTGPAYLLERDGLEKNEEIQKVKMDLYLFQPLFKSQVLSFHLFAARVRGNNDRLQLTDQFWFGGARSLRGYRENQFHGTTVSWINLEYRFLLGRNARFALFNDWGFYRYENSAGAHEKILPGYGAGIRFETPLGIMAVDYALGQGDTFSTGKIHFGIVNKF